MSSIAVVTGSRFPHEDNDEAALLAALDRLDVKASRVAWDDPSVPWESFDSAVIRSTWDYTVDVKAFLAWARRISETTRLLNPVDVLEWNSDKHYIGELSAKGIPTVPTRFIEPGEPWQVPDYNEYVIKPVESGGGRSSGHFVRGRDDENAATLATEVLAPGCTVLGVRLTAARALMVQPYVESVDVNGETSLLFLGDTLSHAIRKGPVLAAGGDYTPLAGHWENISSTAFAADEVALADQVLELVPGGRDRLAYARVDMVRDSNGQVMLMELELIEPSLFLYTAPGSVDILAKVLAGYNGG